MDLNEYLETIIEFDKEKPWGIVAAQLIFDAFRKYCIDYIQDTTTKPLESLYDLVFEYTDESFKKYVDEIFIVEHIEQFETAELCLEFFKKFITFIDTLGEDNEEKITDFLDYNIYKYIEILLNDDTEYWFFPYTYEDDLHIDTYEFLRTKLYKPKKTLTSVVIDTPIDSLEQTPVKSLSRAFIKNKHKQTKKNVSFSAQLAYSKTKKLHK